MRSQRLGLAVLIVVMLGATLAGAAAAQSRLPRLPPAHTLSQTGDSPGKVVFNHESHVDSTAPNCTGCHPKLFKILKPGAATDGKPITHAAMNNGQSCGVCHNGRQAFAPDDCTRCHRSE